MKNTFSFFFAFNHDIDLGPPGLTALPCFRSILHWKGPRLTRLVGEALFLQSANGAMRKLQWARFLRIMRKPDLVRTERSQSPPEKGPVTMPLFPELCDRHGLHPERSNILFISTGGRADAFIFKNWKASPWQWRSFLFFEFVIPSLSSGPSKAFLAYLRV